MELVADSQNHTTDKSSIKLTLKSLLEQPLPHHYNNSDNINIHTLSKRKPSESSHVKKLTDILNYKGMKPSEYAANHYASYGQMEAPNSKLEYMELDEFLRENGIQGQEPGDYQLSPWLQQQQQQQQQHQQQQQQQHQQQHIHQQQHQQQHQPHQIQHPIPQLPLGHQSAVYQGRQHPYQRYQHPTPTPSTPNTPTDSSYPYNSVGYQPYTQLPSENGTALLALDAFTAHHHSPNTPLGNPNRAPLQPHLPHNPNSKRVARSPIVVAGNGLLSPPTTPISPTGQYTTVSGMGGRVAASPDSQHRLPGYGGQLTSLKSPAPSSSSLEEDSASSCSSQPTHERLQGSSPSGCEDQRRKGSMHNGTGNGDCNSDSADQISLSKVKTEILDEDPDLQDFYGVLGKKDFNPKTRTFACSELKPQPMVKKATKVFVPEERKDNRYWTRRRKNNIAAKRSRDARRSKENQIVLRASFLEQENNTLREQLDKALARLSRYETIDSSLSPPPALAPLE